VERRPGSGGRRISIRNQDEQLLTVIRNSPFTTATAAVNISNFPGSVKTSRRRLRNTELRNHAARDGRYTSMLAEHRCFDFNLRYFDIDGILFQTSIFYRCS
jgi:hypothetical protein